MGFERVYTVWEYYDGARSGIADYAGLPHYYHCEWNEVADDYADTFILTPVDDKTVSSALEQWEIWLEWEHKFNRGEVEQSTHPALPGKHERYTDLRGILDRSSSESTNQATRAHATFQPLPDQGHGATGRARGLEVEWNIVT